MNRTFSAKDGNVIKLGATNLPPRLISFTVSETGMSDPIVTLQVGHDGIVTHEWQLQVGSDLANQLIRESLKSDSALRHELDGNKPTPGVGPPA